MAKAETEVVLSDRRKVTIAVENALWTFMLWSNSGEKIDQFVDDVTKNFSKAEMAIARALQGTEFTTGTRMPGGQDWLKSHGVEMVDMMEIGKVLTTIYFQGLSAYYDGTQTSSPTENLN